MVIDTSAIVAILFGEPEAETFEAAIDRDPIRLLSAGNLLELAIVVGRRFGDPGDRELDLLVAKASLDVVSVGEEQISMARAGFRRFGKGRHPAGLNYGDCFAYALARISGEPLLFKGGDFSLTDLTAVVEPGAGG